ncbi:MAG: DUF4350 domain-containing protein [Myxococcaceae bacterium]|nr:DUF4350 domain-containing protein [Myxococcaceae bacterium]
MKLRSWALYGLLLAAAVGMAAAAGSRARRDSPVPSIDNPGPAGARAVYLYLKEAGFDVEVAREALTPIPPRIRTVVIAAPTARKIGREEIAALDAFAKAGGTVVFLGRRLEQNQPALADWLQAGAGPRPRTAIAETDPKAIDPAGADVDVWLSRAPLAGVRVLRVGNEPTLNLARKDALPAAGAGDAVAAWRVPRGSGDVFVLAGADLIENRRIELGGNLTFWHQLAAQGPILFDEFHHTAAGAPPLSTGVVAIVAQLAACFVLFALVRGARLGPPRPELPVRHRSTLEYLASFAWLTRRARVERELLRDLHTRFRVLLHDRLGVAVPLPDEEAARELERQCRIPVPETMDVLAELQALAAAPRVTPKQYAAVSRRLARIERVVTGRAAR